MSSVLKTGTAFDAAISVTARTADRQALWHGHLKAQGLSLHSSDALWQGIHPLEQEAGTPKPDTPAPLDHLRSGPHLTATHLGRQAEDRLRRYDRSEVPRLNPRALTYELYGFLLSGGLPAHHLTFALSRHTARQWLRTPNQQATLRALASAPPFPASETSTAQLRGLWKRLNGREGFEDLHRLHVTPSLTARSAVQAARSGHQSEVWIYLIEQHTLKVYTHLHVLEAEPFTSACLNTDAALGGFGPRAGHTLLYLIQNAGHVSELGGFQN